MSVQTGRLDSRCRRQTHQRTTWRVWLRPLVGNHRQRNTTAQRFFTFASPGEAIVQMSCSHYGPEEVGYSTPEPSVSHCDDTECSGAVGCTQTVRERLHDGNIAQIG